MIDRKVFDQLPNFQEYFEQIIQLFESGRTTGPIQNEKFLNFTKLSLARTRRGLKTLHPSQELIRTANLSEKKNWLVITEAWCGDAGNILPLIVNLAREVPEINLRIALRDEYPHLMDMFLTEQSRSIPIFVAIDDSMNFKGFWGPRPKPAQLIALKYKSNPVMPYSEFQIRLQKWYLNDKGKTLDAELIKYLRL